MPKDDLDKSHNPGIGNNARSSACSRSLQPSPSIYNYLSQITPQNVVSSTVKRTCFAGAKVVETLAGFAVPWPLKIVTDTLIAQFGKKVSRKIYRHLSNSHASRNRQVVEINLQDCGSDQSNWQLQDDKQELDDLSVCKNDSVTQEKDPLSEDWLLFNEQQDESNHRQKTWEDTAVSVVMFPAKTYSKAQHYIKNLTPAQLGRDTGAYVGSAVGAGAFMIILGTPGWLTLPIYFVSEGVAKSLFSYLGKTTVLQNYRGNPNQPMFLPPPSYYSQPPSIPKATPEIHQPPSEETVSGQKLLIFSDYCGQRPYEVDEPATTTNQSDQIVNTSLTSGQTFRSQPNQ